eukprot:361177-Chlamydomonas_euryale.AAC.5
MQRLTNQQKRSLSPLAASLEDTGGQRWLQDNSTTSRQCQVAVAQSQKQQQRNATPMCNAELAAEHGHPGALQQNVP